MYFDFEDYRPDITPVGRAISWREGILLSLIVHMAMVILPMPRPSCSDSTQRSRFVPLSCIRAAPPQHERTRSCSSSPGSISKRRRRRSGPNRPIQDRMARALERAPRFRQSLALLAGNTRERVEQTRARSRARPRPRARSGPRPAGGVNLQTQPPPTARIAPKLQRRRRRCNCRPTGPRRQRQRRGGGSLGEALRNLQRYVADRTVRQSQGGRRRLAPRFSSTRKASSSVPGSGGSSPRSRATG